MKTLSTIWKIFEETHQASSRLIIREVQQKLDTMII